MRTFFGLELLANSRYWQIADWRDRQLGPGGRSRPANFHITLALSARSPTVRWSACAGRWTTGRKGSQLQGAQLLLDCPGYWPRPAIFWLGPATGLILTQLAKMRQLATAAGARRDRNPFQPHITLYRHCQPAPPRRSPNPESSRRTATSPCSNRARENRCQLSPAAALALLPPQL